MSSLSGSCVSYMGPAPAQQGALGFTLPHHLSFLHPGSLGQVWFDVLLGSNCITIPFILDDFFDFVTITEWLQLDALSRKEVLFGSQCQLEVHPLWYLRRSGPVHSGQKNGKGASCMQKWLSTCHRALLTIVE